MCLTVLFDSNVARTNLVFSSRSFVNPNPYILSEGILKLIYLNSPSTTLIDKPNASDSLTLNDVGVIWKFYRLTYYWSANHIMIMMMMTYQVMQIIRPCWQCTKRSEEQLLVKPSIIWTSVAGLVSPCSDDSQTEPPGHRRLLHSRSIVPGAERSPTPSAVRAGWATAYEHCQRARETCCARHGRFTFCRNSSRLASTSIKQNYAMSTSTWAWMNIILKCGTYPTFYICKQCRISLSEFWTKI